MKNLLNKKSQQFVNKKKKIYYKDKNISLINKFKNSSKFFKTKKYNEKNKQNFLNNIISFDVQKIEKDKHFFHYNKIENDKNISNKERQIKYEDILKYNKKTIFKYKKKRINKNFFLKDLSLSLKHLRQLKLHRKLTDKEFIEFQTKKSLEFL
jgi:hypothetical protein